MYEANNGNLISSTYGNNNSIDYTYDNFGRVITIATMDNVYNFFYDNNSNLSKIRTNTSEMKFEYDFSQKISKFCCDDFKVNYIYNECDNIIGKNYCISGNNYTVDNTLNKEDFIVESTFDNDSIKYNYDNLGRICSKSINNDYNTHYRYLTNGNKTSFIVDSVINNNDIYKYHYDELFNITKMYHNNQLVMQYSYDSYNQLIEEKDYINREIKRYMYDDYGNILNVKILDLINYYVKREEKYEYNNLNWKDQLTNFNDIELTYDSIGNPLTIGNDTLTWINGRQLSSYNNNIYKYNHNSVRTSKIVNGIETKYYTVGTSIIFEKTNNNVIYYMRNDVDDLIGFKYDDKSYYYVKNLQDDVIGILDENNNLIVNYQYDSWGNILSITDNVGNVIVDTSHIGIINPYRYRSYYYDKETNLYYLNNRYYSPLLKRFLNADSIIGANQDVMSYNLYAYCGNNPIMYLDSEGYGLFGVLVGAIKGAINGVTKTVTNVVSGDKWYRGVLGSTFGGFVEGYMLTTPGGFAWAGYVGALVENGTNELESYFVGEKKLNKFNLVNSIHDTVILSTADVAIDSIIDSIPNGKTEVNHKYWITPKKKDTIKNGNYTKRVKKNALESIPEEITVNMVTNYASKNNTSNTKKCNNKVSNGIVNLINNTFQSFKTYNNYWR